MITAILGKPGVGKTRLGATWPKPLFLNGEPDGNTSALREGAKPNSIEITMDPGAIVSLVNHLVNLSKLEPDENGEIEYKGVKIGSVVLDSLDAFQDIAKMNIQNSTNLDHMRARDWGTLEARMREPLLYLAAIKVPVVIISHVKIVDSEDDKFGRVWWSAQGSITKRLNRLPSEILHIFINKESDHFVATEPFIFNGYELLAKDRHNKLNPIANKYGLVNIESDDDYPPDAIVNTILGRENGQS